MAEVRYSEAMRGDAQGVFARASSYSERQIKYFAVAPAVFILLLVGLFPLIYSLVVSFQNIDMMGPDTSFQGLRHYRALFADVRLWEAILHTLVFTVIALPLELIIGLMMAFLFLDNMPGRRIFIALLVLPTMIAPLVAGATWRLLFDNRFGPINQILSWFSGEPVTILWTVKPEFVYPAILIAEVWQWTPFMFLILLAGISSVDQSQIEAAQIDGAGPVRIFWKIVIPTIWPVMAIAMLIRGLDLFRLFDVVWALTGGGPGTYTETISVYAYVQGFRQFETSYTGAIAFLVIAMLSAIVIFALKRMEINR